MELSFCRSRSDNALTLNEHALRFVQLLHGVRAGILSSVTLTDMTACLTQPGSRRVACSSSITRNATSTLASTLP